jgi:IS5 family transposase
MAGGYEQARRDVRKIDRRVLKQVNNLTNAKTEWRGRVRTKNLLLVAAETG